MRPFTTYRLYPEAFTALQQPLVDIIVQAAKPDRIFLLGASLFHRRSESIFQPSAPTAQHVSDCFVLVLLQELAGKELHEWQDKIETHCKALLPVTSIVLPRARFEAWLVEGHRFATAVQQQAAVLYNAGNGALPEAAVDLPAASPDHYLLEGLTKASEFLSGSELYRLRQQYALAAFMLHQSAEQALRTLLKAGTGYHANTHSIERLVRYASLVSYQLPDLFPQRTEQERRLFNLLQKAYIDTRYKEHYTISDAELLSLTEKVRRLHEILCAFGKSIVNTLVLSPAR